MANPTQYYDVIRRPLMTEKTTSMQQRCNQFCFEVSPKTNKVEVRKAIETLFSVHVEAVNIIRMPSKRRRMFGRPGATRPWKKAVVTLRKGETIEVA
ncbi:MAG: 50S ribosomal protein L23 [Planctomycetes bacterium]|nr:50S ribosomal protein L23 [Planctomycetota bacterium]